LVQVQAQVSAPALVLALAQAQGQALVAVQQLAREQVLEQQAAPQED